MILRALGSLLFALALPAQSVDALIERLDKLERDNNALRQEIERLRGELGMLKQQATAQAETQEITSRRLEEQAQAKVEASQKFPIRLRGMALVNFFHNGARANGADTPTTAARTAGRATSAVTFRQTVLGFDFQSPRSILGAEVTGSVFGDFYEGNTETSQYPSPRLRTAEIVFAWKTRSLMFGQEKTLVGLRDPTSLAYSGVSPMTAAGNLWRWQPQIRFEQRLALSTSTQALVQAAVVQTAEESGGTPGALPLERRRPALQGRLELAHNLDANRRFEIAGAFHASTTHAGPYSIPSRVYSVDWFANPVRLLEFSGVLYGGQNLHHFGAFRQGWAVTPTGAHAIHTRGGWAQLSVPFHPRVSLNLIAGAMDDRNRDLTAAMIASNRNAAANLIFRIAPNVLVALEAMQIRTLYLNGGLSRNPRYDLSIAYQF
ncbi:MAG: hypothetical protein IT164_13180 [Bryobacterales bacterium]|nr:hypothetical protein [Bryobacterales bacterium]